MGKALNLVGVRFERLIVIREHGRTKHGNITWWCRCDCGKELEVPGGALRKKNTRSCGCWKQDHVRGETNPNWRHGGRHSKDAKPEYDVWRGIKQRCHYEKHIGRHYYGGRGITMCDRWKESFIAFYEDMGPRPSAGYTIDRIDNDGSYSPENCRWALRKEQMRNRRCTIRLTYRGVTKPLMDWADLLHVSHNLLRSRYKRGWPIDKIFGGAMCENFVMPESLREISSVD